MARHLLPALLGTTALVWAPSIVYGGPVGGNVTAGHAAITGQGTSSVKINQSSQRVVIDWQNFDTSAGDTVQYIQPNGNAIALNRILSGSPTQFNGALHANGNVIIMNGNGVIFGSTARVDVGGLVATTAGISNERFMQDDKPVFNLPGKATAQIINNGHITARDAGLVGFVAPQVVNNGVITAQLGKVQLASGDTFTLDLYGDGLVEVKASDAIQKQLVKNTGTIQVDAGIVAMTVAEAKNTVDSLINNSGIIEATSFSQQGGTITLHGPQATVIQHGTLNASGKSGGKIDIAAKNINLNGTIKATGTTGKGGTIQIAATGINEATATSLVDASGATGGLILQNAGGSLTSATYKAKGTQGVGGHIEWGGSVSFLGATLNADGLTKGGTIRIGGVWQTPSFDGWNTYGLSLDRAHNIFASNGTTFSAASTGANGVGGEIVLRAEQNALFGGILNTKPGTVSGQAGRAEISGNHIGLMSGYHITTGYGTRTGDLLLDPKNITIAATGSGGGPVDATQITKLAFQYALSLASYDQFGASTAFNNAGTMLAVGAPETGGRGAVYLFSIDPNSGNLSPVLQQKIENGVGSITLDIGDQFGAGVAFNGSGSLLAVGATGDDTGILENSNQSSNGGAVYLLGMNTGNMSLAPVLHRKLVGGVDGLYPVYNDQFGSRLALNDAGTVLAIGAMNDDTQSSDSGAVYLIGLNAADYSAATTFGYKLNAVSMPGLSLGSQHQFGSGLALNGAGTVLAVGAMGDNNNMGAVYLFNINPSGLTTAPVLVQKISGATAGMTLGASDKFGSALAMTNNGKTLAVGAMGDDTGGNDRGAAYILSLDTANLALAPVIEKKIAHGNGVTLNNDDNFGNALALNGDGSLLSVGSWYDDAQGSNSGDLYLFKVSGGGSSIPTTGNYTLSYGDNAGTDSVIAASDLVNLLGTGNNIILQANNDITVNADILVNNTTGNGGNLTLQAGRSVVLNANVTTDNGNLTVIANDDLANGVVDAHRDAGAANITMASGTTINTGSGSVVFDMRRGIGKTNRTAGQIVLRDIQAGSISMTSLNDIFLNNTLASSGDISLRANRNITVNTSSTVTSQGGNILLNSDADNLNGGVIALTNTTIRSNGGNITLAGGLTGTGYAKGFSDNSGHGVNLQNVTLDAEGTTQGGNILVKGQGWADSNNNYANGVRITEASNAIKTNFGGGIEIDGIGGGTGTFYARGLITQDTTISVVNGTLKLTGIGGGGAASVNSHGVYLAVRSLVESLGTGDIIIHGTGGQTVGSSGNVGIAIAGGSHILSKDGKITLTGMTGVGGGSFGIWKHPGAVTIGGSNATNTITLITNKTLGLDADTTIQTTGDIYIGPNTTQNTSVGNNVAGTINISSDILSGLQAGGTVHIGHNGTTRTGGIMTINTPVVFANNTVFYSNSTLNLAGSGLTTSGGKHLTLDALTSVTLTSNQSLSASGGTIQVNAPINGAYNLTLNSKTLVLNGAIGAGSAVGNVTITTEDSVTLPSITTTAGRTVQATVTGANNMLTVNNIATGASGRITLIADDMTLNGALSGTGVLTLQPYTVTRDMHINNGIGTNALYLDTDEVNRIANGWGSIVIGNSNFLRIGTSTWKDPMTFRQQGVGAIYVDGDITGTDNASIAFANGTYFRDGSVTTNNQNVSVAGNLSFEKGGSISTGNGNISVSGNIVIWQTNLNSAYLTTTGGTITANSLRQRPGEDTTGKSVIINAGSGAVNIASTIDGRYNLSIAANTISIGDAIGSSFKLGDITLRAVNSLVLPSIAVTPGKTVDIAVSGAANSITANSISAGTNGNIILTADDLVLNGDLTGTGSLTVQTYDAARRIGINYALSDTLDLSTDELNHFLNGWNTINIGREGGSGIIDIATSAWRDPVVFRIETRLRGSVSGTDNTSFRFKERFYTSTAAGSLSTQGGHISFDKSISVYALSGSMSVTSNGADIIVNEGISQYLGNAAGRNVILDAGTGSVMLDGPINGAYDLALNGNTVTLGGNIGSDQKLGTVTINAVNNLTLPNTIHAQNVYATVSGAGNSITANTITTGANGNITLTADDLELTGILSGTGNVTIAPYTDTRATCINYTCTGSYLDISSAELNNLASGWSLMTFARANSGTVYIGERVWNNSVKFLGGAKQVYGNQTLNGVSSVVFERTATYLNGYSIKTNGGNITFTATNIGVGGGTNSLDAGSGNIHIGGMINGLSNLTINAKALTSTLAWGGTNPLGNISITTSDSVALPSITTAAGKTVDVAVSGAGNRINTSTIATGTNGTITLTADDMTLGGALSGTGTVTLRPYATNRMMYVNNTAGDGSYLILSPTEIGYLSNGWQQIVIGRSDNTNQLNISQTGLAASFRDPVTFLNNAAIQLSGNGIAATDDASVSFRGGANVYTNFNSALAAITTEGRSVVFDVQIINSNGHMKIHTDGGNISLNTDITGAYSISSHAFYTTLSTLDLNAGTGDIHIARGIRSASGANDFNVSLTGRTITMGGEIGNTAVPLLSVSLNAVNSLTLPTIRAATIFARTTGATSDITLNNNTVLNASGANTAITLVAGRNFINNAVANALVTTPSARWLVYSTDRTGTQTGTLSGFNRYSCVYGGACTSVIPTTGNGFVYAYTPVLTATPNAISTVYGNTVNLNGYTYTLSGYLAGDTGDVVTGTLVGSTNYTVGNGVGSYTLDHASGTLASQMGYAISYADHATGIQITPRVLTAALVNGLHKVYDSTTAANLVSGDITLSNLYNNEAITVSAGGAAYNNANAGSGRTVSVNGLTLGGTGSENYILAATTASNNTAYITPAPLVVNATGGTKVYGTADGVLGYTYSGLVGPDTAASFTGGLTRANGQNVNSYAIGQGTLAASGNYFIDSFNGASFSITPAQLTIAANNKSIVYGDALPNLDASYYGLVNGDTADAITGLTLSTTATSGSGVNVYAIQLSGGISGNYAITLVNGQLHITPATLTVTAHNQQRPAQTANPPLTYDVTGYKFNETEAVISGLTVSTMADINSPQGYYAITAGGATAANYVFTYVDGTLTVGTPPPPPPPPPANNGVDPIIFRNAGVDAAVIPIHPNDQASDLQLDIQQQDDEMIVSVSSCRTKNGSGGDMSAMFAHYMQKVSFGGSQAQTDCNE